MQTFPFQLYFFKMTSQNSLELQGNFLAFPLAELLVEIAQARLAGSLRFSHEDQKIIAYFHQGKIVYVVSNARSSRLFDILLREHRIDKKTLTEIPNFTSDLELGKALAKKKLCSASEINKLFLLQIENILRESLNWKSGEWVFNPLARIKEGISFDVNLPKLLAEYARNLANEAVINRFKSLQETFVAKPFSDTTLNLQPYEAFVLSRFSELPLTIKELKTLSGLPDSAIFQTLYVLWLGGFLTRKNWNSAFSERQIKHIKSASISLKRKEPTSLKTPIKPESETSKPLTNAPFENVVEEITEAPAIKEKLTLEEYLAQNEKASNHYETLGVTVKSAPDEIKKSYFAFAKQFHPDLFHRSAAPDVQQKIQHAFTKIANAYENLRDKDLREIYDYKLRKELAQMEERQESGQVGEKTGAEQKETTATEQFEQGYNLLIDEYHAEAVPFLARASHLAPDNARYHAFYGKALAYEGTHRHKAETEIQAAIKLDPNNELYRIISAEFFIHYNLLKRAEGELKRLLAIAPNNREAHALLDSLQNK